MKKALKLLVCALGVAYGLALAYTLREYPIVALLFAVVGAIIATKASEVIDGTERAKVV